MIEHTFDGVVVMSDTKKPTKYALGYEVDGSLNLLTENDSILFARYSNGKTAINPDLNKIMYFDNEDLAIEEAKSQGCSVNGYPLATYEVYDNAPDYIDRHGAPYSPT